MIKQQKSQTNYNVFWSLLLSSTLFASRAFQRFAIPCPVYELQYWYHKSEYHKSFTVFIVWFAMVSHLNVSHLLMVMSDFSSHIICNQKYRAVDAPIRRCPSELLANPNNGGLPPSRTPQASSLPRRLDLANDLQSHLLYSIRLWRCCITKRRTWSEQVTRYKHLDRSLSLSQGKYYDLELKTIQINNTTRQTKQQIVRQRKSEHDDQL